MIEPGSTGSAGLVARVRSWHHRFAANSGQESFEGCFLRKASRFKFRLRPGDEQRVVA